MERIFQCLFILIIVSSSTRKTLNEGLLVRGRGGDDDK
jgi:hypothetical protein